MGCVTSDRYGWFIYDDHEVSADLGVVAKTVKQCFHNYQSHKRLPKSVILNTLNFNKSTLGHFHFNLPVNIIFTDFLTQNGMSDAINECKNIKIREYDNNSLNQGHGYSDLFLFVNYSVNGKNSMSEISIDAYYNHALIEKHLIDNITCRSAFPEQNRTRCNTCLLPTK